MSFLEFCNALHRCKFKTKEGKPVPKYILYWNNYRVDELLFNRTDVICEKL